MGARLWSQRRSARSAPASHHAHTIITPTTFTHSDKVPAATDVSRVASVRRYHRPSDRSPQPPAAPWPMEYRKDGQPAPPHTSTTKKKKKKVKEGSRDFWSGSTDQHQALHSTPPVLVMSMEHAREHATLQRSVQQDTRLGFPHQVPRSDGEERHPPKKYPIMAEHDETKREFIKPPANKTVNDVVNEATHRPSSFGVLSPQGECGAGQCGPYSHHQHHHPTSSSSSSSSQPGYGDEGRSSPRRQRRMGGANLVRSPLLPQCRAPFSPIKYQHDSSPRGGWPQGGLGMNTSSPSHDPNIPLPYPSASNTLADITTMPVGCGPTHLRPGDRHVGMPVDSQAMSVGSLGVQQSGGPHRYRQFSESPCSPTAESDDPPYSDVIDNSSLYNPSVSRPSEQRTKCGKI